jgi:alpha-glucuronidase
MRWNNNTSGFVLRRMAQTVSNGSRSDKTYKDKVVNVVAKALRDYAGVAMSSTQVYNHLRKWKQKWAKVARLKDLIGATFDDEVHAIMLD